MSQQDDRGNAARFIELFGNYWTGGMFSIVRWIYSIIVDSCTMLLLVIVRKNIGYKLAKQSEWIFTGSLLFLLVAFSAFGTAENDVTSSSILIWYHGIAFLIFSTWRQLGAWMSMRGMYPKFIAKRLSNDIGESVIYPLLRFILKPIGLIDDEVKPKTIWKVTHDRWLQWIEPLLILLLGVWIIGQGYEIYGKLLIVCSVCVWRTTMNAYNNTAKVKQAKIDAEMLHPAQHHKETKPHVIQ